MNFKKIVSAASALTIAASAFVSMGVVANAEAKDNKVAVSGITYIDPNNSSTNYSTATTWIANQNQISGGAFKDSSKHTATVFKLDLSAYKSQIVTGVTLTITSKADTKASEMLLGTTVNEDWEASALTWDNYATTLGTITQKMSLGYYQPAGTTTATDIKSVYDSDSDGILSCVLYTGTAREQTISEIYATVTTTTVEQVAYTISGKCDDVDLGTIASGKADPSSDVTVTTIPKYITKDSVIYELNDDTVTNYSKTITLGTETTEAAVTYKKADSSIVFASEAEDLSNSMASTASTGKSKGAYSAITGAKTASIGTFSAGKYKLTVPLVERGDRGIYVRDANNSDNTSNTIATIPIDKNSAAGTYSVEFTITEATALAISGRNGDNDKINQSAGFDYVVLERTGDATKSQTFTFDGAANDFTNAKTFDISATQDGAVKTTSVDGTSIFGSISGEGTYKLAVIFTGIASDMTLDSVTIK